MEAGPYPPRLARGGLWTWLSVALIALHLAAVAVHFPARLADPADPFGTGDATFYYGSGMDAAAGGGLSGYSPSYMAGYPYGLWASLGRKGYEAAATFLPFGAPAQRFYAAVVGMAAATPLLLGLAAVGCGAGWAGGVRVAGFGAVVYQLCDPLSYLWTSGNVAFPFASALAVVAAGVFRRPTAGRAVLAGLISAGAVWVHTLAAVPLAIGLACAAAAAVRGGAPWRRVLVGSAVLAAVAAALVLPGHWHYLSALDLRAPMRARPLPSGARYLVMDLFNDRAYRNPFDRRALFHVLLVLATWQGVCEWRERRAGTAGLWLAAVLTLGFGYAAGHAGVLKQLQPYRFVVSAELFLSVPAALGAGRLAEAVRRANPPGRAAAAAVGLMLLPALTGHLLDLPARRPVAGLSADEKAAAAWVAGRPPGGRVLCEPDGLGNLLPHLTGREVIGGGISHQAVLPQQWATAQGPWAFGRAGDDLTPDAFLRACRLLDVRTLLVSSDDLAGLVGRTPAELVATFGPIRAYTLPPDPAAEVWPGCYRGQVTAGPNRITIANPPAGRFVLNYHYARGFTPAPGVRVSPATVPGAGAPFIEVDNQSSDSVITLTFGDR